MKKGALAAFLCCLLFWGAFPATCQGNQAKAQFAEHIKNFHQKTPDFPCDQPLSASFDLGLSVCPEPMQFNGNLCLLLDPGQKRAELKCGGIRQDQSGTQDLIGSVYLDQNRLIIPRTVAEILTLDAPEDPDYYYIDYDFDVWPELWQNGFAAASAPDMDEAFKDLLLVLLKPIPDRCFIAEGSNSTMKFDKIALLSLFNAFRDPAYVAAAAEPLATLCSQPSDLVSDFLSGFLADELDLSALSNLAINEFSITISSSAVETSYDLAFNTDGIKFLLTGNGRAHYASDSAALLGNIAVIMQDEGDNEMQLSIQVQGHRIVGQIQGGGVLTLEGIVDDEEIQARMTLAGMMKTEPALQVVIPVLTASNSLGIGEDDPDETVMVSYKGDFHHFAGAYLTENRLMVSVFDLIRIFGFEQEQDRLDAVVLSQGGKDIAISAGSDICLINGVSNTMGQAAVLKDYEIYVPFRFLMEAFGYVVSYDETNGTVSIE